MRALQARKRPGWVKNKGGEVLTDPVAMAQALEEHWADFTSLGLSSLEDCMAFLRKLKQPSNFAIMSRAPFRPLFESLGAEALDRLHCSSSPGFDGISADIYTTDWEFFQPLMFEIAQDSFSQGSLPPLWDLGLINCIPKAAGLMMVSKLRPIALQDIKKKWLMNIVCLQVEQIFQQ